ncbi:MAG: amino acid ABC transporter permease [Elainellaceae cyanobacterium]
MTTSYPPASASPPPIAQVGLVAWMRKNLFNSWFNGILTILLVWLLGSTVINFVRWAFSLAQWQVIPANLPLYFVGRFPASQYWRVWVLVALLAALAGQTWGILAKTAPRLFSRPVLIGLAIAALIAVIFPTPPLYRLLILGVELLTAVSAWIGWQLGSRTPGFGKWLSIAWAIALPIALWLLLGGFGLRPVNINDWGGMLLTVFVSVLSILLSFPLGVLLALGRQSTLPVIRGLSTAYIELVRGLPLLSILFFASVMVPLFIPSNIRLNLVIRAIIGLTLFTAAYLAETIRGGLQSIPRGQTEASRALGLSTPLTLGLIILPQALKVSIPAIVGLFISLLQDTTLLLIIGLFELLGISRAILANPQFIGRYAEVYLFIGLIFWVLCYAMSWGSRRLEQSLNTTH